MKVQDETDQEINEALFHIASVIRDAQDFRKKYLLDLADDLLDAKLDRENK